MCIPSLFRFFFINGNTVFISLFNSDCADQQLAVQ